jgi:hypothetical protein
MHVFFFGFTGSGSTTWDVEKIEPTDPYQMVLGYMFPFSFLRINSIIRKHMLHSLQIKHVLWLQVNFILRMIKLKGYCDVVGSPDWGAFFELKRQKVPNREEEDTLDIWWGAGDQRALELILQVFPFCNSLDLEIGCIRGTMIMIHEVRTLNLTRGQLNKFLENIYWCTTLQTCSSFMYNKSVSKGPVW